MFKYILVAIMIVSGGCVFHDHDDHHGTCYEVVPYSSAPDYCSYYYDGECCEWYNSVYDCWDEYCNWDDYCGWEHTGCHI